MRDLLQKTEPLDEVGNHGLADPAESKADDRDAKLDTSYNFVKITVKALKDARADPAGLNELLDPGLADADQGKLGSSKECVGRNQGDNQQYPEQHKSD